MQKYIAAGQKVLSLMKESAGFEYFAKAINDIKINEEGEIETSKYWNLNEADSDELKSAKEDKLEIQKKITASIDSLSPTKLEKALGKSEKESADYIAGIKDQWKEIQDQFQDAQDDVLGIDDEIENATRDTEDGGGISAWKGANGETSASTPAATQSTDNTADQTTQSDDNLSAEDKAEKTELEDDIKKAEDKLKELEEITGDENAAIEAEKLKQTISDSKKKLDAILAKAKGSTAESSANIKYELMALRLRFNQDMIDLGIYI